MKRDYTKPTIHVEVMSVDMPVAASCSTSDGYSDMHEQGWFTSSGNCDLPIDGWGDDGDTICYHSAITTSLAS